jgi:hypothetical protein
MTTPLEYVKEEFEVFNILDPHEHLTMRTKGLEVLMCPKPK